MIVGLDLRCLPSDGSDGSGVAHAARELCACLVQDRSIHWIVYIRRGARFIANGRSLDDGLLLVELLDSSGSALRRATREQRCDVLFVPTGAIPPYLGVPAVPLVHDLTIFDHPEWFPQSWCRRLLTTSLFIRGLRKAPLVFTVSEYTKKAVLQKTGKASDRVMVTGEGGDAELLSIADEQVLRAKAQAGRLCREEWGIVRPFVLALGTVEPRKNLAMLLRAWRKSGISLDLVLAGNYGWKYGDVINEISDLSSKERVRFHRIEKFSDEQKRTLLLAAKAVAVPSLDEGFGLVALEAMQARTKLLSSNRGALPEVMGSMIGLLDPEDEAAWIVALRQLTVDERPRIFNSIGLGAAVGAIKGSKNTSLVSVVNRQTGEGFSRIQVSFWTWERAARVVIDGLKTLGSVNR